jgi:hypothetical protein
MRSPQTNFPQASIFDMAPAPADSRSVRLKAPRSAQLTRLVETPGAVNLARWTSLTDQGDIMEFMRQFGYVGAADFRRRCSERTFTVRKQLLMSTFKAVKERNRGIKTLAQFTPRLIPQILDYWSEEVAVGKMRHGYETQVQGFSVLAWFWRMHGIKVEPIKHFIEDPQQRLKFARSSVATRDKSWAGNGIDVDAKIEEARAIDPVVARLIYLAKHYGLRAKETLFVRPHEDDKGDRLHLSRGTKTGRPRDINYNDFGAETLQSAIEAVKADLEPGEHAAWKERSLKEARRRLYYVLECIGLTKKQSGVTFHGLRTQWAIEQFERLTGTAAPVRGGGAIDYRQFADTRRTISRAMGHNRIAVTSAYYGSFFKMRTTAERRFNESWERLQPHLAGIQDILDNHGIANLWFVGRRANGANHQLAEGYEFLIDESNHVLSAAKVTTELVRFLEASECLGLPVTIHVASMHGVNMKRAWAENALPLFDVEAPHFRELAATTEPSMSPAPAAVQGGAPGAHNETLQ